MSDSVNVQGCAVPVTATSERDVDQGAKVLLAVAAAAKAWRKAGPKSSHHPKAVERLAKAVDALIAIGW